MMVALVLTVCAIADPKNCHMEEYLFESDGNLVHCMFEAPPYLATWAGEHPGWQVARWTCDRPGRLNNAI